MPENDYLIAGTQRYQNGDYHQAEEIFSKIIQMNPDNHVACFMKGMSARHAGNLEKAIRCIERAVSIHPDSELYYNHLAEVLFEAGRTEDAVIALRKSTDLIPLFRQTSLNPELLRYLKPDHDIARATVKQRAFCCFSFPKCGTTLLSDIVQKITGLQYCWPETMILSVDILKEATGNQFLIGHFRGNPQCFGLLKNNHYRIIANYRDPRDMLVSFYYYYRDIQNKGNNEWGHLLRKLTKEQALNALLTTRLAGGIAHPANMANWLNTLLELKRQGIPVLFLTYEDIVQNKIDSIFRIANFLGYEVSRQRIQEILTETSFHKKSSTLQKKGLTDNDLKRKGIVGDWRNHFTQSNIDTFNAVAGKFLIQLGYEPC